MQTLLFGGGLLALSVALACAAAAVRSFVAEDIPGVMAYLSGKTRAQLRSKATAAQGRHARRRRTAQVLPAVKDTAQTVLATADEAASTFRVVKRVVLVGTDERIACRDADGFQD